MIRGTPRDLLVTSACAILTTACGGKGAPSTKTSVAAQQIAVYVQSSEIELETEAQVIAAAYGMIDNRLTWSLDSPSGVIDGEGKYSALAIEGDFRMIASSVGDDGAKSIANVRAHRRESGESPSVSLLVASPVSITAAPTPSPTSTNVITSIAADMQGRNEGHPHGVPADWGMARGSFIGMGNNPKGWRAATSWGVVYEAAEGNPSTNARVNLRKVQLFVLSKRSGKWSRLQNTNTPEGSAYRENFSGQHNKPADVRRESDGTISVTVGDGFNYHFFPAPRARINPSDVGGVLALVQARLILADPTGPDDRGSARVLVGSGGDYYPDLTGGWGSGSANPSIGGGKMKYVKRYWRFFAFTTLSAAQLRKNPPPVQLHGVSP